MKKLKLCVKTGLVSEPKPMAMMALLTTVCLALTLSNGLSSTAQTVSGDEALKKLSEGNARYIANEAKHPRQTAERRAETAKGQTPFAIILTCADSRVAPEVVFDQGLGDLFVLRNAGNVLDDHMLGSMEYAVEHLNVSLVVVLGHSQCGAVAATVAGGHAPGHIHSVVEAIEPALENAKDQPGDKVDNVVRANAKRGAAIVARDEPLLKEAVKAGKLKVVSARYDISTGQIEFLN